MRTAPAIAAACVLMLSACQGSPVVDGVANAGRDAPRLTTFYVQTVDGRAIPCVFAKSGYGGGLSCDWGPR